MYCCGCDAVELKVGPLLTELAGCGVFESATCGSFVAIDSSDGCLSFFLPANNRFIVSTATS